MIDRYLFPPGYRGVVHLRRVCPACWKSLEWATLHGFKSIGAELASLSLRNIKFSNLQSLGSHK